MDNKIESSWSEDGLKRWSDEKLQANITACELQLDVGTGDDFLDWEHSYALSAMLEEQRNRRDRFANTKISGCEPTDNEKH